MQECTHCRIRLIIGITGELLDNGTNSPDIVCQNCGQVNQASRPAYSEPSEMECDMCGKIGGVRDRGNDLWMCAHCYTVWNS